MEEEQCTCLWCKHLDRYYTRETRHFRKTKLGWCRAEQRDVEVHGQCGQFVRKRAVRGHSKFLLENALEGLLTEISELREILETEEGEREREGMQDV